MHDSLHVEADVGGAARSLGIAEFVEPRQRGVARIGLERAVRSPRLDEASAMLGGLPPEDDQIEQRIRSQPIRPMHGHAGRLADRHQARHQRVGVAVPARDDFAVKIAGYSPHIIVHGGQHRNWFLVDVDVRKDAGGLGDTGQPLFDDGGPQVFEMQVDVILVLADTASLANLDGHGTADHIPGRQVLRIGRVAFHESVAGRVRQIAALAARALGDEAPGTIDSGRMELNEFHVLKRQPGAQCHASPVSGTGVRRCAREPRSAVAAGGENHLMRAEAVQSAVRHVQRDHAAAFAVFHDQVERKVLDEKTRLVLQRLLIQRVQHSVPGAVGRGAGSLRDPLAEMRGHAAERALIDLATLGA